MTMESHKGSWCPYKMVFCQEPLCSNCQIFYDWSKFLWGGDDDGHNDKVPA